MSSYKVFTLEFKIRIQNTFDSAFVDLNDDTFFKFINRVFATTPKLKVWSSTLFLKPLNKNKQKKNNPKQPVDYIQQEKIL